MHTGAHNSISHLCKPAKHKHAGLDKTNPIFWIGKPVATRAVAFLLKLLPLLADDVILALSWLCRTFFHACKAWLNLRTDFMKVYTLGFRFKQGRNHSV